MAEARTRPSHNKGPHVHGSRRLCRVAHAVLCRRVGEQSPRRRRASAGVQYQIGASRRARPTVVKDPQTDPSGGPGLALGARASRSAAGSRCRSTGTRRWRRPISPAGPGWDGFGSLVLWAAYAEHPALRRPASLPEEWDNDPALMRSNAAGFRSRYSHLVRNVELWLPSPFEFTFEGEDIDGQAGGGRLDRDAASPARRSERARPGRRTPPSWRAGAASRRPTTRRSSSCARYAFRGAAGPRPAGGRAQTADETGLLTAANPPVCRRGGAGSSRTLGCGDAAGGGSVAGGRLRRSFMNSSNSARSLAARSRSRKSRNSRCSSSSLRSVSSRYSSKATLPLPACGPSDGGGARRGTRRALRGLQRAVGSIPVAVAAMPRAKHASTPFQVDEKGEADRPEHDEAQRPPGRSRRAGGCRPVFPSGPSWWAPLSALTM